MLSIEKDEADSVGNLFTDLFPSACSFISCRKRATLGARAFPWLGRISDHLVSRREIH